MSGEWDGGRQLLRPLYLRISVCNSRIPCRFAEDREPSLQTIPGGNDRWQH